MDGGYLFAGFWQALNMLATRTTRGDALFHALIAGVIVGGAAFAGGAGDRMWLSHNQGVRSRTHHVTWTEISLEHACVHA